MLFHRLWKICLQQSPETKPLLLPRSSLAATAGFFPVIATGGECGGAVVAVSIALPSASAASAMSYQGIYMPAQWSEAAESITFASPPSNPPIVFVCGPKNTGKSTFARHLVNVLLQR